MPEQNLPDASGEVIEALYELPLGGEWQTLQKALCRYWMAVGDAPAANEISALERHFSRALAYLERIPAQPYRWLNELYRLPLAAAVIDPQGSIVDCNDQGRGLLKLAVETDLTADNRLLLKTAIRALDKSTMATAGLHIGDSEVRMYIRAMPEDRVQSQPLYLGVIVSDQLPDAGFRLLAHQYKLTPRETDLCLELSAGTSLDELAKKSSVKKTTLRTHLANCFSKLNVNSQPELVSLVLHHLFASAQLNPEDRSPPRLTPYLDPEIHGFPKFALITLTNGRKLGYFEYGDPDGIPAIYCHGSFETGMVSKSQRLHGNGVRLFAVERPGVGESSPTEDYSPQAYARDLMEFADQLGLRQYAVVGRSMGSWDAIELAMADTDRVKLLVFASCKLPVEQSSDHIDHLPVFQSLYNAIWQSDTIGRLMLRMLQLQMLLRGPEQFVGNVDALPEIERRVALDPNHVRVLQANWQRCACHGVEPLHAHLKLYRDPVPDPPWKNLAVPTVLVHGDQDRNVPLDRVLHQTASFQDRKVVILENFGHQLIHMAMGELLRILRSEWDKRT